MEFKLHKQCNNNEEEHNKCSIKKRTNAFDFLQKLALERRQDESIIVSEETPHQYLKNIHESQNIFNTHNKPILNLILKSPESVKSAKTSLFKYNEIKQESEMKMKKKFSTTSQISQEIILGLDSILKNFESPKIQLKHQKKWENFQKEKIFQKNEIIKSQKTLSEE